MQGWKPKGSKGICYINQPKGITIEQLEQRFGSEIIKEKLAQELEEVWDIQMKHVCPKKRAEFPANQKIQTKMASSKISDK